MMRTFDHSMNHSNTPTQERVLDVADLTVRFASSERTVDAVRTLMQHPDFTLKNPNRARALVFQFCINNLQNVHTPAGYDFWAEQVLALDAINPEIAARLARVFEHWARFEPTASAGLKAAWQRIQGEAKLSPNVAEALQYRVDVGRG